MLNKDKLVDAFNEIDPEYINSARDRIGYGGREKPKKTLHVFRTVLIAAVITALMVGTAYAADLFGLKSKAIPAEDHYVHDRERNPVQASYLSLNGVAGSREYQATAEWIAFSREYQAQKDKEYEGNGKSWQDWDLSFAESEEEKAICLTYSALDATMQSKLKELAGKYELELLRSQNLVESMASMRKLSGMGQYTEKAEYSFGYIFEDGSLHIEGDLPINDSRYAYSLTRVNAGTLYPFSSSVAEDQLCEEWEYTAADGSTVDIALFDEGEWEEERGYFENAESYYDISAQKFVYHTAHDYRVVVMLDNSSSYVTVSVSWRAITPYTEEDDVVRWGYTSVEEANRETEASRIDPYQLAEDIADCFNYAALMENSPTVTDTLNIDRSAEANPEAAAILRNILNSDEYKACVEYQEAHKEICGNYDINSYCQSFIDETKMTDYSTGANKADEVKTAMKEAAGKYDLTLPASSENMQVNDKTLSELGQGRLVYPYGDQYYNNSYDNGAFTLHKNGGWGLTVHCIPKGSFFGGLNIWNFPGAEDYTKVWPYETVSGATVCCAAYGDYDYGIVVYETENAYVFLTGVSGVTALEGAADEVDFTQFK